MIDLNIKIIAIAVLLLLSSGFSNSAYAFTITDSFGWRSIHPVTGEANKFHTGTDYGADYGTAIPVIWDGIVYFAGDYGGYGNAVLIQHNEKTFTLYAHCSQIYVGVGQSVKCGQTIAAVGSSGISTGPHVHVEYWYDNQYYDPAAVWPW